MFILHYHCKSVIEKDAVMTSIENYDGMQGVTALPIWNCEDNGTLNEVNIMLSVGDDSRYTCKEIEDKLVEKYNKLFGNAYKDNVSYHWTTKNSKILLGKLSNKYVLLSFKK